LPRNNETDTIKFDEYYTGWSSQETSQQVLAELEEKKYIPNKIPELFPMNSCVFPMKLVLNKQ
jgi:hypothetical protein